MKKKKVTYVAEVVIKNPKRSVPDWGLGKGVLASREVTFTDTRGRGFESPLFALQMHETGQEIIGDTVEVRWTIKK